MNDFECPKEYANHILQRRNGDRRAAVKHIVNTHGVNGSFWREAIQTLRDGMAKWETIFPDFPSSDMPDIPEAWEDSSCPEDASPSFTVMSRHPDGDRGERYSMMKVWINEADPAAREATQDSRFFIAFEGDRTDRTVVLQADDWQEVLSYVNERVSLAKEYTETVGYNPFLDEPRIDPNEVMDTLREIAEIDKQGGLDFRM